MGEEIRVLHVDDEPDFADVTAEYLHREDDRFRVETATSADEGCDLLSDDIDCVVSDYEMPGRNGIEFLTDVREAHADLPFILFTGKGSEEIASEAISAGVTDYLRKRTGTEQYELLAARIRTAVGQYRAERELERQNDLFEKAQDLADVGVWEWYPEERDGYYSEQVYEIYGIEARPEGTPEMDIEEFYHPDDRETLRAAFERAVETGTPYDVEVRVTAADGTVKWVRTRGDPQFEDGTCVRVRGTIRDITDRKERERQLEQQRRRLSVALEGANAGVWEWVPETNEVIWHESTERLFGLDPGEFEGTYEAFARRVHDDDIETLEETIETALATHDPFECEYRIHTDDGRQLWTYARGEFVDIEGFSPRYIGVITDITARKERERDLEETKEWYRTLLDSAPDAVFVADAETGDLLETNQAATEMLGRSREEIVGMHQTDLHPPEKAREYAELFEKHVAAGEGRDATMGQEHDIYAVDADGDRIPVEITARVVEIEGKQIIQGYFRDITGRKEREQKLQESRERYRSLFENNPLVIWEEDFSAAKQPLAELAAEVPDVEAHLTANPEELDRFMALIDVIDVNRSALEYYDAPSKDALMENIDQVFTAEARETFASILDGLAAGETRFRNETVARTLEGEKKHELLEVFVPEEHAEDFSRVFVTGTDITDRKEQEAELRRKNERLEEFASVVSHDLRSPLTVLDRSLELAREDGDAEHFDRCQRSIDRMSRLIEDLLMLAREGKEITELRPVDPGTVANRCWGTLETGAATLVTDTSHVIRADPDRLQQLLENLVTNAVEHGGEDVTVRVGELDDGTGFYVADDGPGIPPEEREEVFESGYSTAEDGTGFGLSIVRTIANAHGWEIRATDSETGGARFEITGVDVGNP